MHTLLLAFGPWLGAAALAQDATPAELPSSDTPSSDTPSSDAPSSDPASSDPPPPTVDDIDDFLGQPAELPVAAAPTPTPAAPPNALNPRITAFGDVMTTVGVDADGVMPGSGPWLRSFELDLRADVDPFAKAVAVIALHQEQPELEPSHDEEVALEEDEHDHVSFSIAPEEVYIDLVSLPGGLSARLGQQKLPFGLTNRMHPHDWAWPDAPLPFEAVMGEEGMADVAATAAWTVPNPWAVALTLTGAVTAGDIFDSEREDALPGWLGRAEYFGDYGQVELGLGASSTGQRDARVDGADAMLRWRKNSWRSVVLMGELFRSVEGEADDDHDHDEADEHDHETSGAGPIGWTTTLQVQPTRPVYVGLRVDQYDDSWQYAAYLSYYTSEFLRLRVGATTDLDQWIGNAQLTFVWGSHPVEPYWVNR